MGIPLNSLTNEMVRSADMIWAIDRARPGYVQFVFGQDRSGRVDMSGKPPHRGQSQEVEIDSAKPDHLQILLRQVESVKGRLPEDVQHLKQPA
jgi:hypothetical protein